jgi:hypothetical protein
MPTAAVVSEQGQVTWAQGVLDPVGIRPGSRLERQVSDDRTPRLRVLTSRSDALLGLLAREGEPSRSIERMDEAVTDAVEARSGATQVAEVGRRGGSWCRAVWDSKSSIACQIRPKQTIASRQPMYTSAH